MQYVEFWPIASVVLIVMFFVYLAFGGGALRRGAWLVPAALCAAFTLFSIYPVVTEGPFGFWPNHSQTFWGNQVWIDLLLALGVACYFIADRAKQLGIRVAPWLLLVLCSGSIGVLAFLSRVLFVQERTPK